MKRTLMHALAIAALAAVYASAARLGLELQFLDTGATPVWPPTGIAIATLLLAGLRLWPGVFIGAFVANLMNDAGAGTAAGIAAGNTLEAVAAVWLTNHFCHGRNFLDRPADIFRYALLVGGLSTAISATVGVTSVCLGAPARWESFGPIWITWWLGDTVSALTLVPFLITWLAKPLPGLRPRALVEAALLIAATIIVGQAVFGGWIAPSVRNYPLGYAALPLLLWGAYRFGTHGAVTTSLLLAVIAISGTLSNFGPFVVDDPNTSLVIMQGFVGVMTLSALALAAAETARRRSTAAAFHAESALSERVDELRALLDLLPIGVLIAHDPECRLITANRAGAAMLRLPSPNANASMTGPEADRLPFRILKDGVEVDGGDLPMQRCTRVGQPVGGEELDVVFNDGTTMRLYEFAAPLFDAGNRVRGCLAASVDLTERRRAEEALRAKEAELEMIASRTPLLLTRCGKDRRFRYVNRAGAEFLGRDAADIIGRPIAEVVGAAAYATLEPHIDRVLRGEHVEFETEVPYAHAGPRYMHAAYTPDRNERGEVIGWVGSINDVTERRQIEEALRESEARFRAMVNATPAILWTAAPGGAITWASDQWFEYTGIPRDQSAREWPQVLHPDDLEPSLRAWTIALESGTEYEVEARNRRHDGDYRWFLTRAAPVRDRAGAITGWFGSTTDIHERKMAEQASARLASIVTSSEDAMISKTLEGVITSWNEGAERLFGYTADEAVGRPIIMLIPPERHAEEDEILARLRRGERISHYETVRMRKDGRHIDVSLTVSPLLDRNGKPVGASKVARDISDRKRAEQELMHHREHLEQLVQERTAQLEKSHEALRLSERMAALGTLAAGLGHDMGNLLLPIKARLDVLQHSELPGSAQEHLAAIAQCANYLQALTRGLRLFARDPQQDAGNEATVAQSWLAEVAPFFESVLTRDVKFRTQIEPDLPALGIAAHALTQATLNLVNNAKDALAGRGGGEVTLTVAAEPPPPAPARARSTPSSEARDAADSTAAARVRITVRDTGPGMSAEVRARAVEPFFTTKSRGISTGLGLSLVHGIISAVGGELVIESEPGRGTAVSLLVPTAQRRRLSDQPHVAGGAAVISVGDARQSALLRAIVESLGYAARAPETAAADANDPGDALIWFTEAHADRLASAQRFLAGDARRRIIVVGDTPPEWTALGVHSIPGRCNLATVRAALSARRLAPAESSR